MFKFLNILADFIVYRIFALSFSSKAAETMEFFIYNVLKIFILILIIGFVLGVVRELITPARTKHFLSNKNKFTGNILSSFLAVITPVESFSVIPVCIGFLEAGIPVSTTFTYLITAPMTNELAFTVFWSLFGYKIAFIYYAAGIITGLTGGIIIGLLNLDKYIQPIIRNERVSTTQREKKHLKTIILTAIQSSFSFFKSFWLYILVGVGFAALIQNYMPLNFFLKYAGANNPFAVPVSVLLVILFYVNITMILPVIIIFAGYNIPVGTIIAFTMAVTATSVPEVIMLKKALKFPLILVYMAILLSLIVFTGYLLNFLIKIFS